MRTPSQTAGPYFAIGLSRRPQNEFSGGTVVLRGRVLDGEGNPVDDALGLVRGERPGLAQHGVDQRGLAVVDVGDDRDVAQVPSQ